MVGRVAIANVERGEKWFEMSGFHSQKATRADRAFLEYVSANSAVRAGQPQLEMETAAPRMVDGESAYGQRHALASACLKIRQAEKRPSYGGIDCFESSYPQVFSR